MCPRVCASVRQHAAKSFISFPIWLSGVCSDCRRGEKKTEGERVKAREGGHGKEKIGNKERVERGENERKRGEIMRKELVRGEQKKKGGGRSRGRED